MISKNPKQQNLNKTKTTTNHIQEKTIQKPPEKQKTTTPNKIQTNKGEKNNQPKKNKKKTPNQNQNKTKKNPMLKNPIAPTLKKERQTCHEQCKEKASISELQKQEFLSVLSTPCG